MTNPHLAKLLGLGPVRRFLERSGDNPALRRFYEKCSGAARVHETMDAARSAIRHHRPETRGHLERNLIGSNFHLSAELRVSDYPALFWLRDIAASSCLKVFDFGGGVGQTFVSFSRLIPDDRLTSWTVQDLPEVILQAGEYFPTDTPGKIEFTSSLADASDCNVLYVAGALHYWERPMSDLLRELGASPTHVIINRSPMRAEGESYCTVQEGNYWAVACKVRSLDSLKDEMKSEGYEMVDSWEDPEKSLKLPWLPAYSCSYRGAYFRKIENAPTQRFTS
jgi:putative methyltransferase (TIGR04325 family)